MSDQSTISVILMTANVGSIFEDADRMLKLWLDEFQKTIKHLKPSFVALHLQELGGKNFEASMQHVNLFVKSMFRHETLLNYDRAQVFLDEDYTATEKYTALGSIYFIHEDIDKAEIWSFQEFKFIPVEGKEVLSGNIESIGIKEKAKFPQHFFPEFKWSRKGFLRTRWNLNNCIFDLVNIHLFHDASNLIAMQKSPSVYALNRQRTFLHTLERFSNDQYDKVPMFIFGDFNFRLDLHNLLTDITQKLVKTEERGKKDQLSKVTFHEDENIEKPTLTVTSKRFDYHHKHSDLFSTSEPWLQKYNNEFNTFVDRLFEFDIHFYPSYPFREDVDDGVSYMKTRCPSWCDRVFMTHDAKSIIDQGKGKKHTRYEVMGKSVCMGDHKPVYLFFQLLAGKGNIARPSRRHYLTHCLSINGEACWDISDGSNWDVHDYAQFEDESSLKRRSFHSLYRQPKRRSLNSVQPTRGKTMFSLVKKVNSMSSIVNKFKQVHSSSSEDEIEDDDVEKKEEDAEQAYECAEMQNGVNSANSDSSASYVVKFCNKGQGYNALTGSNNNNNNQTTLRRLDDMYEKSEKHLCPEIDNESKCESLQIGVTNKTDTERSLSSNNH